MADLIVPAGTVLTVDHNYAVAPRYGLLRLEAGASIVATVDLTLKADSAEFEAGCVIDAHGAAGAMGANGAVGVMGGNGGHGAAGGPGAAGHAVSIEAALTKVGGLTIVTSGGAGGRGGEGGTGGSSSAHAGNGGGGGDGGSGGDAGQLTLAWTWAAPGPGPAAGAAPAGHVYRSDAGAGGQGGPGGSGGYAPISDTDGFDGAVGANGPSGKSLAPQVTWLTNAGAMLWAQAQDMGPAARSGHGVVFAPDRGKLVLFGGLAGTALMGDTWEWDGKLWTQVQDVGPAPRAFHGMAWDAASQRVLVFGGANNLGGQDAAQRTWLGDTWAWDGQTWVQVADTGPSARQAPAMAGDPARRRVVLFSGGQITTQADNQAVSDTWEWDGAQWRQVADSGPSSRLDARMAYDQSSAALVLFGGSGADQAPADTWVYDGHQWTQVADTGPGARVGSALAAIDTGVILFGGMPAQGGAAQGDTWAWRNGSWRQIQDMGPSPRQGHAMDGVSAGGLMQVMLFGGAGGGQLKDTWRLAQPG